MISFVKILSFLFLAFIPSILIAQSSFIRGSVFEDTTGEPLPGVTVIIDGTTQGTTTDFDGKFNLKCNPGNYVIKFSFISFETITINNVVVKMGEVTLLDNIRLKEAGIQLAAVTITHEASKNTETALQTIQKRSATVIDGISAVTLRRIGDTDAAASMKRVTGVSVEGGKYVFVRGLGDRYTKTILNGLDIPGLDPDRNTLQMDIFPTNIIDNIIVHKSFSAELPADFTGGVIDIALKDFPDERKRNISISTGYNKGDHFNSNYLTYQGGKTDFLGFDDGTREIPAVDNIPFFTQAISNPNGENGLRYREILESFSPIMAAEKKQSLLNYGFGINAGNQIVGNKFTFGYNFAISYKSNTEFTQDAVYGRFGLSNDITENELVAREFQKGDFGTQNYLLSGLGGFALKNQNSKVRLYFLHIQNAESKAGIYDYIGSDKGSNFEGFQHNLDYSQRALTNILLDGKHTYKNQWEIVWKLSPTLSSMYEPDSRFTRYIDRGGIYVISTESGFPERIWRNLDELNIAGLVNITKDFKIKGKNGKLRFGGAYTFKERDFIIRSFAINVRNIPLTGNPNELFQKENLWPYNGTFIGRGTGFEASFVPSNPNQFNAKVNYAAAYLSAELNPLKRLKTILGFRLEQYTQYYTGQNQLGTIVLDNDKVLDDLGFFPALNIIFSLTEKQNLRFSYSRTIARPSLKELSYAEIADPISGRTFIGGLFTDKDDVSGATYWDGKLESSRIHNIDLRWEIFMNNNQMTSISVFYKQFNKPLEIVQYATQVGSFQPRNVGDGTVLGAEFEFKFNLNFISEQLEKFTINSNITVTKSQIKLSKTEFESKQKWLRSGQESISEYREMAGQAPIIVNAGIAYNGGAKGFWKGFETGLYFNVQGTTLLHVGINDRPDIYQKPFPSLNFSLSKKVGSKQNSSFDFKVSNLLNRKSESIFTAYNASSQIYSSTLNGTTFSLGYNFQF
jgi:hypothetical protein